MIDGKWTSDHRSAKELWSKLLNVYRAVQAFRAPCRKTPTPDLPDLMSFNKDSNDALAAKVGGQETASEGTGSDAGYSSLLSTEDLTRPQPVAGGRLLPSLSIKCYGRRVAMYFHAPRGIVL